MGNPFQSTAGSDNSSNSLMQAIQSFANNGSSSTTPTENPIFSAFRQSILPAISAQYQAAQKDVYGAPQVAQVAQQGNAATKAATDANTARAARTGTLNAGNTAATNASAQAANTANITGFENQIPMLNQQAKFNNTNSLLGMATNFLGRAPLGSTSTSNQNGTSASTQTGTNTSSGTQFGNPSIFNDIGLGAGAIAGFIP